MLGLISFNNLELLGYSFIFLGVGMVYIAFSRSQAAVIFSGTSLFLVGILLFVVSIFEFASVGRLIIPSLFLISGTALFMIWINETWRKIHLISSIILIFIGFVLILFMGSITFVNFANSVANIILNYWPVLLIVLGIVIIIKLEERRR
jgi:hypothetical protein